jgi:hypothetical protein
MARDGFWNYGGLHLRNCSGGTRMGERYVRRFGLGLILMLFASVVLAGPADALRGFTSGGQCSYLPSYFTVTIYSTPIAIGGPGVPTYNRLYGFDVSSMGCAGPSLLYFVKPSGEQIRIAVLPDTTASLGREELSPFGLWRLAWTGAGVGTSTTPDEVCALNPDLVVGPDGALTPATC